MKETERKKSHTGPLSHFYGNLKTIIIPCHSLSKDLCWWEVRHCRKERRRVAKENWLNASDKTKWMGVFSRSKLTSGDSELNRCPSKNLHNLALDKFSSRSIMSTIEITQWTIMLFTSLPDDWDPDHHDSEGAHFPTDLHQERKKKNLKGSKLALVFHISFHHCGSLWNINPRCKSRQQWVTETWFSWWKRWLMMVLKIVKRKRHRRTRWGNRAESLKEPFPGFPPEFIRFHELVCNHVPVILFFAWPPHTSGTIHAISFILQVYRPKDTFLTTAATTVSIVRQPGQEFYMEKRERKEKHNGRSGKK